MLARIGIVALMFAASLQLHAQPQNNDPQAQPDSMVQLNFPKDVELTVLVEYVSQRLGINFIYDEQLANKRLTIKAPQEIPASSLLGLLESALHIKGFTLVDAAEQGFMRIAPAAEMTTVTQLTEDEGQSDAKGITVALTQVVTLKHADTKLVESALKPYLSKPGGNIFSLPDQDILIISDMAVNVRRIVQMASLLDQPTPQRQIEVYTLTHAQSKELAQKVKQIMQLKDRTRGRRGGSTSQMVECVSDDRTNQIMAIGTPEQLAEIKTVIQSLDIPIPESQNPVKFYKLFHRSAEDVLATLKNIQGEDGLETTRLPNLFNDAASDAPVAADMPAQEPEMVTDTAYAPAQTPAAENNQTTAPKPNAPIPTPVPTTHAVAQQVPTVKPKLARVAADIHTNSIVVVAKPPVQQIYAALIKQLDRRRPQVLLEATVITLDTSDDFTLGVEIAATGNTDTGKIISFSSFGLSTIDASTGDVTPATSTGFNFALLDADIANVVLKALQRTGKAKVASAPKILVNDNESGSLISTANEPFSSVNASDTVATTSYGGDVSAGTTINLTPHISNGDYLQLEYNIELSSFTGDRVDNLPPPSQTNTIESKVTIPDGKTIVLGGLKRNSSSHTLTTIPILGDIPLLKELFTSRINEDSEKTLFVFIKASILRDDSFRDLQYLSDHDVDQSEHPGDYPRSEPVWMN
ncbi:MAG: secretin N-terminal domain-containing protein [Phycisphaeraceae bacterium JB051]